MRRNYAAVCAFLLLTTFGLVSASEFNPKPDQSPDNYSLGPDRESLPFKDDIGNEYGAFIVSSFDDNAGANVDYNPETENKVDA